MEGVRASHPDVAECAVIGVADALKGQLPVGFVVLKAGADGNHTVAQEVVQMVRERIGPVAAFKSSAVVKRLPKPRSGKILRATTRQIAHGTDVRLLANIHNPTSLDDIKDNLAERPEEGR